MTNNIEKLEEYFGVQRVIPRRIGNTSETTYVYVPDITNKTRISFGTGTVQKYIGSKTHMCILPNIEKKTIIFYPCDNGDYMISKGSSGTASVTANTLINNYIPKVKKGRYIPETLLVGDIRCFSIKYEEN